MRLKYHVKADLHITPWEALRALFRPHRAHIVIFLDVPPGTTMRPQI